MNYDKFHIVSVISNPLLFKSRYNLYEQFSEDIQRKGAKLWTVEMATGARDHKITLSDNHQHIQVWNTAIPGFLWHKENLVNIVIQQLTIKNPDWRYVAWVDADIKFEKPVLQETVERLQYWDVVQMWSHAVDFAPDGAAVSDRMQMGFMYAYWNNINIKSSNNYTFGGHPGYAWAARRDSLNKLGGLVDHAILGSADRHMACALLGRVNESMHGDVSQDYKNWCYKWEERAEKEIKRNVGYVPGVIRHGWHGSKATRGYSTRWRILVDYNFQPTVDLRKDVSGLWTLNVDTPRQRALRDAIRKYFFSRREDTTV